MCSQMGVMSSHVVSLSALISIELLKILKLVGKNLYHIMVSNKESGHLTGTMIGKSGQKHIHEDTFLRYKNNYLNWSCLLYTSPSPRDGLLSRMPSSA